MENFKPITLHVVDPFPPPPMEYLDPDELNQYLCLYLMSIKKVNGEQFEPSSLTNKLCSLDRHLGDHSYSDAQGKSISLLKDAQFKRVRDVLKAKRIDLRQQGKGQKPNKSKALSLEEEEVFWEKGVFGTGTPFAIQFSIFYFFTLTMGLRGRDEHRKMTWGDVALKEDGVSGKESLIFRYVKLSYICKYNRALPLSLVSCAWLKLRQVKVKTS